ncbi:Fis family transcriptional regulator [Paraburkholderia caribensis]|uniref:Fis family transcriptional regulator n=1 Tax=Paraburkholderia caribensis TaxID=75105 RepID=UPI0011E05FDD|nr:Fis family transcriptional regulator [Paraburkholderia caribensis]
MKKSSQSNSLARRKQQRCSAKADLLPLPSYIVDRLSLEYHIMLEALSSGHGTLYSLQLMTRVGMATAILSDSGYGLLRNGFWELYDATSRAYGGPLNDGHYRFDESAYALFCRVLTVHDQQMRRAPVAEIEKLAKRLEVSS